MPLGQLIVSQCLCYFGHFLLLGQAQLLTMLQNYYTCINFYDKGPWCACNNIFISSLMIWQNKLAHLAFPLVFSLAVTLKSFMIVMTVASKLRSQLEIALARLLLSQVERKNTNLCVHYILLKSRVISLSTFGRNDNFASK